MNKILQNCDSDIAGQKNQTHAKCPEGDFFLNASPDTTKVVTLFVKK